MNYLECIDEYLDQTLSAEEMMLFDAALVQDVDLQIAVKQERAIRAQFSYLKTRQSVLDLHKKKESGKKSGVILPLVEDRKIRTLTYKKIYTRVAAAAAIITFVTVLFRLYEPQMPSDPIAVQTTPAIDTVPQIEQHKEIGERKQKKKGISVSSPNPGTERIVEENKPIEATPSIMNENPIHEQFAGFYKKQIARFETQMMGSEKTDELKKAQAQIRNNETDEPYNTLIKLHKQYPNDTEISLTLALCTYKKGNNPEAIRLLKSIRNEYPEVEDFLKTIKE